MLLSKDDIENMLDILGTLKYPIENALDKQPFIHDANKPPPNVTIEWTTGLDTALKLRNLIMYLENEWKKQ